MIAAPASFLFPSVKPNENVGNFVCTVAGCAISGPDTRIIHRRAVPTSANSVSSTYLDEPWLYPAYARRRSANYHGKPVDISRGDAHRGSPIVIRFAGTETICISNN